MKKTGAVISVVEGVGKPLVILVDFNGGSHFSHQYSQSQFNEMLFSQGTYSTGSMNDYFQEVSYERYSVVGDVTDWATAPQSYAYYCNNQSGTGTWPQNSQGLVYDMVTLLDSQVDFSRYDTDGDGYLDGIIVIVEGEYNQSNDNRFWAHKWALNSHKIQLDGIWINRYCIVNEQDPSGNMHKIGTFCHEWGHVIGLPDLYDYTDVSEGIGYWGLMGSGNWNTQESPAHLCAWSKIQLGWITPTNIAVNMLGVEIRSVKQSATVYKLWSNGISSNEYFLIENRQAEGFDKHLKGAGLLIWHIDDNQPDNDNYLHKMVDLEESDGEDDLDFNRNRGDAGDPYPGSGGLNNPNTIFDATSYPNSRNYAGSDTHVRVINISASASLMRADFYVSQQVPVIVALPQSLTARPGQDVAIPITVSQLPQGIYSFDFEIEYDTTVVEPAAPYYNTSGSLATSFSIIVNPSYTASRVKIVGYGMTALPENEGTLFTTLFKVKSSAQDGLYNLSLHNLLFNQGEIASTIQNGAIQISSAVITLDISDTLTAIIGGEVNVPIVVMDSIPAGVYSFDCEFDFDANVFEPFDPYFINQNTLSSDFSIVANPAVAVGKIKYVAYGTAELTRGAGVLFYVKMKVKQTATEGTYSFTLSNVIFNAGYPAAALNNGGITVLANIIISGSVVYCGNSQRPIPGVTLTFIGPAVHSVTTDAWGAYTISLPATTWKLIISKPGDETQCLTGFDASLIARYCVGLISFDNECQIRALDVDGNGMVQAIDAAMVARKKAGFQTNIGKAGAWAFIPDSVMNISTSSTINFKGVVIGDGDLSWQSHAVLKASARSPFFELIRSGPYEAMIYSHWDNFDEVYGLNFDIVFENPKTIFDIQKLQNFEYTYSVDANRVKIVIYSINPIANNVPILKMYFLDVSLNETIMAFENIVINNASIGDMGENAVIAKNYEILQNYPNPFNPSTTIRFQMPTAANVTLKIFDINGRLVRTLVSQNMPAGYHNVVWDGTNDVGVKVGSGVYICRMQAGSFTAVKRMVLIR